VFIRVHPWTLLKNPRLLQEVYYFVRGSRHDYKNISWRSPSFNPESKYQLEFGDCDDDDATGNIADIDYGTDGSNAISTVVVGDNGLYNWDVTSLVSSWLADPSTNNGLALSGLFGNVNLDGRNSYGIFHTVGSTAGLPPTLTISVVPEPGNLWGILLLGSGFMLIKHHRLI
jgi:hypothetical protein